LANQKTWRDVEKLPANTTLFNVYDTTLYSTYQPEMTVAEVRIVNTLLPFFNPHCIFVDSYFQKPDGKTTQVDIIAVGKRGVFVFESKDYSGWIFGGGTSSKWTQSLAYGHERHSFYNPIKQNQSHINTLKQKLNNQNIPFFSIIALGSNAEIKAMELIPERTFVVTEDRLTNLMSNLQEGPEVLTIAQVREVVRAIQQKRVCPNNEIRRKHITDIQNAFGDNQAHYRRSAPRYRNTYYNSRPRSRRIRGF
jgi:hypothetical protein